MSAKHFLPRLSPVYESVFRQRLVWTGLTRSLEETAEHRRRRKPPVLMRCETKPWKGDRDIKWLIMSRIVFSIALSGLFRCVTQPRGLAPPSVVYRTIGALFSGHQYKKLISHMRENMRKHVPRLTSANKKECRSTLFVLTCWCWQSMESYYKTTNNESRIQCHYQRREDVADISQRLA